MALRFISAAFAFMAGPRSARLPEKGHGDRDVLLQLSTRQMLDDHLMRDIGLRQGRLPPYRRRNLLDL